MGYALQAVIYTARTLAEENRKSETSVSLFNFSSPLWGENSISLRYALIHRENSIEKAGFASRSLVVQAHPEIYSVGFGAVVSR
jgi:hypothetical protein